MFALQRGEDSWHDSVRLHDDHINTTAPWVLGTEDKAIKGPNRYRTGNCKKSATCPKRQRLQSVQISFKGANTASYHDQRSSINAA